MGSIITNVPSSLLSQSLLLASKKHVLDVIDPFPTAEQKGAVPLVLRESPPQADLGDLRGRISYVGWKKTSENSEEQRKT